MKAFLQTERLLCASALYHPYTRCKASSKKEGDNLGKNQIAYEPWKKLLPAKQSNSNSSANYANPPPQSAQKGQYRQKRRANVGTGRRRKTRSPPTPYTTIMLIGIFPQAHPTEDCVCFCRNKPRHLHKNEESAAFERLAPRSITTKGAIRPLCTLQPQPIDPGL